jgi:hypothetical protein
MPKRVNGPSYREAAVNARKILGVGIGNGIGFYERPSKPELILLDPDPDPDVHGSSSATHIFDHQTSLETVSPDLFNVRDYGPDGSGEPGRTNTAFESVFLSGMET